MSLAHIINIYLLYKSLKVSYLMITSIKLNPYIIQSDNSTFTYFLVNGEV